VLFCVDHASTALIDTLSLHDALPIFSRSTGACPSMTSSRLGECRPIPSTCPSSCSTTRLTLAGLAASDFSTYTIIRTELGSPSTVNGKSRPGTAGCGQDHVSALAFMISGGQPAVSTGTGSPLQNSTTSASRAVAASANRYSPNSTALSHCAAASRNDSRSSAASAGSSPPATCTRIVVPTGHRTTLGGVVWKVKSYAPASGGIVGASHAATASAAAGSVSRTHFGIIA